MMGIDFRNTVNVVSSMFQTSWESMLVHHCNWGHCIICQHKLAHYFLCMYPLDWVLCFPSVLGNIDNLWNFLVTVHWFFSRFSAVCRLKVNDSPRSCHRPTTTARECAVWDMCVKYVAKKLHHRPWMLLSMNERIWNASSLFWNTDYTLLDWL